MEQFEAPKFSEYGTPIRAAWLFGRDSEGNPVWQSGSPSMYDFRWLRTRKFTWGGNAHKIFYFAMVGHSDDRRIRDGHKGLFEEAAQSLIEHAYEVFENELRTVRVLPSQRPKDVSDMLTEIVTEMRESDGLKELCDQHIRMMLTLMFTDPDLTQRNPLISKSHTSPFTLPADDAMAIIESLCSNDEPILRRINRALDVIDLYHTPADRLPYRQLEMWLTSCRRVVYAVHHRAY